MGPTRGPSGSRALADLCRAPLAVVLAHGAFLSDQPDAAGTAAGVRATRRLGGCTAHPERQGQKSGNARLRTRDHRRCEDWQSLSAEPAGGGPVHRGEASRNDAHRRAVRNRWTSGASLAWSRSLLPRRRGGHAVAELVDLGDEERCGCVYLLGALIVEVEGLHVHRCVINGCGFQSGHPQRGAVVVRRDAGPSFATRLEARGRATRPGCQMRTARARRRPSPSRTDPICGAPKPGPEKRRASWP